MVDDGNPIPPPEDLPEFMARVTEMDRQRRLLTATATERDKRIRVTVNAEGVLIDTWFADDISDLSYDEIAEAMVEAVRTAATEVTHRSRELMWPLLERDTEVPITSDFLPGAVSGEPVTLLPARQDLPASLRPPVSASDAVHVESGGASVVRDDR